MLGQLCQATDSYSCRDVLDSTTAKLVQQDEEVDKLAATRVFFDKFVG